MKEIKIHINSFWKNISVFFGCLAVLALLVRIVVAANFYTDCTAHFLNAKNAATAEIAAEELSIAINAMESYGYTSGPVLGILEAENAIGFCYSNLLNFKEELENFDSVNRSTEVYNVELNALQERLSSSEPPYLISLETIYYRWAYLCILGCWFVITIASWLIQGSHLDSETFSIWIPSGKAEKA